MIFNTAVRLTPNQTDFPQYLHARCGWTAREFSGVDYGAATSLNFSVAIHRAILLSTGVEGDHSFPAARSSLIHWQFTY